MAFRNVRIAFADESILLSAAVSILIFCLVPDPNSFLTVWSPIGKFAGFSIWWSTAVLKLCMVMSSLPRLFWARTLLNLLKLNPSSS